MTSSRARSLLGAGLLLAVAGCVGEPGAPAGALPGAVTTTVTENGRFIALVGPQFQHADPFLGVPATNFYTLRSWIDRRTGEVLHQLYVEDSYVGDERNWNAAQDSRGQILRFVAISKNEIACSGSCSYAEEFAAAVPDQLLRASGQGLPVLFRGRSGAQMTIIVPTEAVAKQVAAVDAARAAATPAG